jgi:hypothetical protein
VERPFRYATNCTEQRTGRFIEPMVDRAREITWETLIKHVSVEEIDGLFPFYGDCPDLSLKSDYAVRFCKSVFMDKPCYYIEHSCIEYIFLKEE